MSSDFLLGLTIGAVAGVMWTHFAGLLRELSEEQRQLTARNLEEERKRSPFDKHLEELEQDIERGLLPHE